MLRFIIGTAGTGKTTQLFDDIVTTVQAGNKAILLVPEQFSFASERTLYRTLGPVDSLKVEVLSFTRLSNNIFRAFGGLAGTTITPVAKYLLMSVVVEELRGHLVTYQKSSANIDFLDTLLEACGEFKTAGVTPEEVEAAMQNVPEGKLQDKLSDLSALYAAYQGMLQRGYLDPEDDILRACQLLEGNQYFQDYHVFVDGFTTFMAGEFELLCHILHQSPQVTFAMTADNMIDKSGGVGLYSTVQAAIGKLTRYAKDAGLAMVEPLVLTEPVRYQSEDLAHLSKEFLQPVQRIFHSVPKGICLVPAQDLYKEVEQTAIQISQLVQEEGYRYNEIAVVARDHTPYLRAMDMYFSRYQIPFFDDRTIDVEHTPLVAGVLAAVNTVRQGFTGESLLLLAKSPIMGYSPETVAKLENYHYVWQLKGDQWKKPLENNPRGLAEDFTTDDTENLEKINELREQLMTPLLRLERALSQGDGQSFAHGVYDFLMEVKASSHLTRYSDGLSVGEKELFLEENAQLWDSIIDVLDIFGEVLGEVSLGRNRLCELFSLALTASEIGSIPQTLDQVLVGAAGRIRPWEVRAVFVLGANEGVFPPTLHSQGVFSDTEREQLQDVGIEVSPPGFYQSVLERFFCYFALTLPSEALFVSYTRADLQGKEQLPSMMVTQLNTLFPQLKESAVLPEDTMMTEEAGFAVLADHFQQDSELTATLLSYFSKERSSVLSRMERAATLPTHELTSKTLSQDLFGTSMRFSPSRVERYYQCPYSYFARDGLRLQRRQRAEFSPLESGSLLHYVLEIMVKKYGGKGLSEKTIEELREESEQLILEYLSTRVEDTDTLPYRFEYLFSRLCNTLAQLLFQLGKEFLQSDFEPVAFELAIGRGGEIPPLEITSPKGVPVRVEGFVDRVDMMEKNGKKYIRVVDYKSGGKSFDLADVIHGINLQMLLYLFTLKEYGAQNGEEVLPAGVLYMPVVERYLSAERDTPTEELQDKRERQWAMSGLLLEDSTALRGMEKNLEGLYVPVRVNKNGKFSAYSSLATLEQMGKLDEKIRTLVGEMADNLQKGEIPALPLDPLSYPTCEYCDYRAICGYEEGHTIREIPRMRRQDVLSLLLEDEEESHE